MNILYNQTWVGLEPTKFLRAEIEKHFVRFLVEMKTLKFAFDIYWPLALANFCLVLFRQKCLFWFRNNESDLDQAKNNFLLLNFDFWLKLFFACPEWFWTFKCQNYNKIFSISFFVYFPFLVSFNLMWTLIKFEN